MLIRRAVSHTLRARLASRKTILTSHTDNALLPARPLAPAFSFAFRTMSAAAHPVTSTSDPAPPAEGLQPVTPGASDAAPKQQQKGQGKEGKKDKKDKKGGGGSAGPLELNPPPEFFAERIKIFDEYKAKYDKWVSGELIAVRGSGVAHHRTTPKPHHGDPAGRQAGRGDGMGDYASADC